MHFDQLRALPLSRSLVIAVGLLITNMVFGTVGYMLIAEMSFVDALYQTVITLTTVGFREVTEFGTAEKLFTVVLLMTGVGVVFYTFTQIVQESVEGDIRGRYFQRRMELEIEHLQDHHILCGFGRVGQEIARELAERRHPFVVIEENPEQATRARAFGYHVLEGDAANERVLVQAGISRAKSLMAASDSDAGNTYITLTARANAPHIFIVARCALPQNEEKLRLAGADRVLNVYGMGGRRMVLLAIQPLAADFMDTLAAGRQGDLVLAEFEVNEQTGLAGATCRALLSGTRSATVLGLRHRDGTLKVGPQDGEPLHTGDIVIVLAEEEDLIKMRSGVA